MTDQEEKIPEPTVPTPSPTWDLTSTISPYLDLHMMFPLLEFIDSAIAENKTSYNSQDVAAARLSLLRPTHMVDYAMDIYRELNGEDADVPAEMEEQKTKVYDKLEELREGCKEFDELSNNANERAKLMEANQWSIEGLIAANVTTLEVIDLYRQLAKFNYDCGDYQTSRDMLNVYLSLHAVGGTLVSKDDKKEEEDNRYKHKDAEETPDESGPAVGNPALYNLPTSLLRSEPKLLEVLWGKLSCEILLGQWPDARVALRAVQTTIEDLAEQKVLKPLEALHQRTWVLHWSLFVYLNPQCQNSDMDGLLDLFLGEKYLQAISTHAPHLLRYLTSAILLSKRRKNAMSSGSSDRGYRAKIPEGNKLMKDLLKIMRECGTIETTSLSTTPATTDPIVQLIECLLVKFDFDAAQEKLIDCEAVLQTDYFLCIQSQSFMEEARIQIFEHYCRIHHKIEVKTLAEKLAMDTSRAEKWIVDLIRSSTLLNAKIENECVVMGFAGSDKVSVYEQVMEKTKDLNMRSTALVSNLNRVLEDARVEKQKRIMASREDE